MLHSRDPADLHFFRDSHEKIGFFKIGAPGSRGIALKVPEMDPPQIST